MVADVLYQFAVEAVAGEGLDAANDYEFHLGTGHGDVHTTQVAQEANGAVVVVTHHTYDYDVTLLPLESVNGVDSDAATVALEEVVHLEQTSYEARLRLVGSDYAEVGEFVVNT